MCDIWKRDATVEFGARELRPQLAAIERLGVEWVVLTGGEPLMNPGLFELCAELRLRRIRITLLSSGLLLSRYAEQIADHVDEVIVSLDGPAEIHNRIRSVASAYERLAEGVAALRLLKPRLPVAARSTVQRLNCAHLVRTMRAAHDLKLDSISFLAADTHSEAFDHLFPVTGSEGVALRGEDLPVLDGQLEELIASGECDGFVRESPEKLRRIARHFRSGLGLAEPVSPPCNAPWHSAVVEADGTVRPCFFHKPIGKISPDVPLDTVLNGPEALAFRSALDVESNPVCRRCVCSLKVR